MAAPLAILAALGALAVWRKRGIVRTPGDQADATPVGLNADHGDTGYLPSVRDLARAIATAEGFGVPGTVPTRAHNPGDLVIPNWKGATIGAEGISVFSTDTEGWTRLHHQLQLIVDGRSRVYSLEMTIAEFAAKWTSTEQSAWTQNVIRALNAKGHAVHAETTLDEVLQ